ncbi:uncharacterized protein A1O9_11732 [Exophiala aquamarina CBS 119918]|uniref:Carboxymuconolactone decarboxylase-like domain-containing protein n=1 Tax=Exophiala aquamarina CBS 119918 TaxID=1182545 RepID=A0A072NWX4_9EURO|nr:uncharacterized protein A1O9_11732 [Exophiala aquamarina CBS 119918]KEF52106.1 hypothetical protein A1O9_11732 [Exophiala aquamarina CBS 119918]
MAPTFGELSDKAALGKQLSAQFLGEKFFATALENMKDDLFTRTSMQFVWETCFSSYARPSLKWRERALMNIVMMVALNRTNELRIHVRGAVQNGVTEEEICEAIHHAMIYCGVPAGRDAMMAAGEVIEQLKASGEYPKKA